MDGVAYYSLSKVRNEDLIFKIHDSIPELFFKLEECYEIREQIGVETIAIFSIFLFPILPNSEYNLDEGLNFSAFLFSLPI